MALLDQLSDAIIKERGGRHGSKGHEFQRYWTLCHLLELDLTASNFLVLLEFIEDVAVLDTENQPASIDLFQLKKKEGKSNKWTKAALIKPQAEGKSIVAKLFESKKCVKQGLKTISFVSNAPVELNLEDKSDSLARLEILGSELADDLRSFLSTSIAKELGCAEQDLLFDDLKFIRCTLAMDDLENHATGKVASYLAEKFPDHSARADLLCKALYSEIKVKASATVDAGSFDELKKIRGISKTQLDKMVGFTLSRKSDQKIVEEVLANLVLEKIPYVVRENIKARIRQFLIEKSSSNNQILEQLRSQVSSKLTQPPISLITSWDVANWVTEQIFSPNNPSEYHILEKDYVIAIVLYEMNK